MVTYRSCDFLYKAQKKAKTYMRASSLEWRGDLEGFKTAIHLWGYMGALHSACDVCVFHSMVTFWYIEPTPACSPFHYHAHWQLCSVHFACEADDKIFLLLLFYFLFFINIFNWQHFYLAGYDFWTHAKSDETFCWNACAEWWSPKRGAVIQG